MTRHQILGAALVLLFAIVWAAAILGARLDLIWLQLGAGALLVLGSAVIFVALARMDLGRRPNDSERGEDVRPFRFDAAQHRTPPSAGGRALPRGDSRLLSEDIEALRARRRAREGRHGLV